VPIKIVTEGAAVVVADFEAALATAAAVFQSASEVHHDWCCEGNCSQEIECCMQK
jgi:hypothetical protein